jgi:hypothetical protein
MIHALHARQIDRYFAGALRRAAVREMLQRLWRCGACRVRYERHLLHERAVPDGDTRQQERLWDSIVASARVGAYPARSGDSARERIVVRRSVRWSSLASAGALAGVLALVAVSAHLKTASTPVARGTTDEVAGPPNLHLFRTVGGRETEPVAGTIHADDGILIAYSNPGTELSYLMVFAVDAQGAVHWYYPAYEQPGQNPVAPAIRTRALGVELGEEIRHALPVGPLRMVALFLRQPLQIEEVERMVSEAWRSHGGSVTALETLPLPSDKGEQHSRLLQVAP